MTPVTRWVCVLGVCAAAACGSSAKKPGADGDASPGIGGATAGGASGAAGSTGDAGQTGGAGATGAAGSTGSAGSAPDGAALDATGAAGARAPFDLARVNCLARGDDKTTVALVNHCRARVTVAGSNAATGDVEPEAFTCRDVGSATASLPAMRYWGFTAPDPGLGRHTLAELTFNTTFNNFDWYNISHVDAQNLPMQIVAVGMPGCRTLTCAESLLPGCPDVGQYKDLAGDVTACVSPMPNDPSSPVAQYFDKACPDAYSWSGDDADSVVACAGEDYIVVFCP